MEFSEGRGGLAEVGFAGFGGGALTGFFADAMDRLEFLGGNRGGPGVA